MTNEELLMNIKMYEGFSGTRYTCPGGKQTIGFGFTSSVFKDGNVPLTMSYHNASDLLETIVLELRGNVYAYLCKFNYTYDEIEAMLNPLTDFTYNCGFTNLKGLTNNGKRTVNEIIEKIVLYNKSNGKELKGLTKRREYERDEILKALNEMISIEKQIQTMLNAHGYQLTIDGIIGKKSMNAMLDYLKKGEEK